MKHNETNTLFKRFHCLHLASRPLRSRCITSSLYVPEAVKMVPETVTCDIIAICWIWDMLTIQSHAVSEPNRLPEAFWMLFRYVSRIGKIDVSKSFHTKTANHSNGKFFMKFPWDSHQTPGMKLPNQSKSCDTSSWPRGEPNFMQPSTWVTRRDRISRVQEFSTPFVCSARIRELLQVCVASIRHPGGVWQSFSGGGLILEHLLSNLCIAGCLALWSVFTFRVAAWCRLSGMKKSQPNELSPHSSLMFP